AACAPATQAPAPAAAPQAATGAPAATLAPAPTQAPSAANLRVWVRQGTGIQAAITAYEAYRQAQGKPVKVELTEIPTHDVAAKLTAAVAAGDPPDVFSVNL